MVPIEDTAGLGDLLSVFDEDLSDSETHWLSRLVCDELWRSPLVAAGPCAPERQVTGMW